MRTYNYPRRFSRQYCKKTPCRKMGFTQKASCRPYKNCYGNKTRKNRTTHERRGSGAGEEDSPKKYDK